MYDIDTCRENDRKKRGASMKAFGIYFMCITLTINLDKLGQLVRTRR